jgi:hypothetical protein
MDVPGCLHKTIPTSFQRLEGGVNSSLTHCADLAQATLQPHAAVVHCRHAPTSCSVSAQRKAEQAAPHCRSTAATAPSRDEPVVEGVWGHTVGGAGADQATGKLVQVGLAKVDGTCECSGLGAAQEVCCESGR